MNADHSFALIAGEEMGRINCGGRSHGHGGADVHGHAGAGPVRLGGAQGTVSDPRHPRRARGLHRRQRARRRQRRRRDPDPGREGRRRMGHQRVEDLHHERDPGRLAVPAGPDLRRPGAHGMSLLVVPTDNPGVPVSRKLEKLGMWSSDTAELSFVDVRVPVSNTIGEIGRGFQQQMVQFQAERLITVYRQSARSSWRWSARRRTWLSAGPSASPCWPTSTSSSPWPSCRPATTCSSSMPAARPTLSCGARTPPASPPSASCWARGATRSGRHGVQFHGGIGYMDENWTSRYYRDTRLDSIGAGADEVMLRILARMDGYSLE